LLGGHGFRTFAEAGSGAVNPVAFAHVQMVEGVVGCADGSIRYG
jgi:hypothetical protein